MPQRDLMFKISEDIKEIRKKYNYATDADAFVHLCLRLVSDTDDDELCADAYTNGPRDLGIDGILIIESEPNIIHFIQAKLTSPKNKIERKDIKEFIDNTIKILRNPSFSLEGNSDIVRLSRDARDILTAAPETKIVLSYFTLGNYAPNAIRELNDWKIKFRDQQDYVKNFDLQEFDHDSLLERYMSNIDTSPLPMDIVLPALGGQVLELKKRIKMNDTKTSLKSIVFTTKASEIGRIRNKYGKSIFSINVRYSLGSSNEVNKGMINTLSNPGESDKFWFYNNGIYATCSSFELTKDKKNVKINGFQIVNGCQTSTSFGEVLLKKIDLEDVEILVRLVEGRKDKVIFNISRYTNTQNAVKARDLHSNDPIQSTIFNIFQNKSFFNKNYFYERKRGEMQHFSKTRHSMARGRDKIDNKDVAQAFMAFSKQRPSRAKASADILFRDNYSEIFDDKQTEASHLFYPWYVLKIVKKFIKQERAISGQEYLSQSKETFVAFVGYCFRNKFKMQEIEKLTQEFEKMNEYHFLNHVYHYLGLGLKVLNHVAMNRNSGKIPDQNFDARRFFLDQDLFEKSIIPYTANLAEMAQITDKNLWNPPKKAN